MLLQLLIVLLALFLLGVLVYAGKIPLGQYLIQSRSGAGRTNQYEQRMDRIRAMQTHSAGGRESAPPPVLHREPAAPIVAPRPASAPRPVVELVPIVRPQPQVVLPPAAAPVSEMPSEPELPAKVIGAVREIHPSKRGHTAIAGVSGDGKSTTLYTLLVADLARGCQCAVLSRHYAPYNREDQRIDLRPLDKHFEAYRDSAEIRAVLNYVCDVVIEERLGLYHADKPVGQPIVLYLGEWRSMRRLLGKKQAEAILGKILDEGRKTEVWCVVEMHSALLNYLGGDSGLREAFWTRLVGNVDTITWRTFIGSASQYNVPRPTPTSTVGYWATEGGLLTVARPSDGEILMLANRPQPMWPALLVERPVTDDDEREEDEDDEEEEDDREDTPMASPRQHAPSARRRVRPGGTSLRQLARMAPLKTREDLVRLLLLAGRDHTEIRDLVKGANADFRSIIARVEREMHAEDHE